MENILDCRERIKSILLMHGVNPHDYPHLITDLASVAIEWADVAIGEYRTTR